MYLKVFIAGLLAALAVIVVPVATAGSVSVQASPNPVAVGNSFDVTICGLGGKTATFRITEPDGSVTTGRIYAPSCGTISALADQSGQYLIEVLNYAGSHVFASTTETAS